MTTARTRTDRAVDPHACVRGVEIDGRYFCSVCFKPFPVLDREKRPDHM